MGPSPDEAVGGRRRARLAVSRAHLLAAVHHRSRTLPDAARRAPSFGRKERPQGRGVANRLGVRPGAWLVAGTGAAAGEGGVGPWGMEGGGRNARRQLTVK